MKMFFIGQKVKNINPFNDRYNKTGVVVKLYEKDNLVGVQYEDTHKGFFIWELADVLESNESVDELTESEKEPVRDYVLSDLEAQQQIKLAIDNIQNESAKELFMTAFAYHQKVTALTYIPTASERQYYKDLLIIIYDLRQKMGFTEEKK